MEEKTEIMRRYIHREVMEALVDSRLSSDHPIGAVLEAEAQVVGEPGRGCVRVLDERGNWVMLKDRIKELKVDERFRDSVPRPAKVARGDESGLRDNFAQIVAGNVVVE